MDEFNTDQTVERLADRGWQGVRERRLPGLVTLTPLPATAETLADLESAWDSGIELPEAPSLSEGA